METVYSCSTGFIKIQASSNYEEAIITQFAYENARASGALIINACAQHSYIS